MINKIDKLKAELNQLMIEEEKDSDRILEISQQLDILIIEHYKEEGIYAD